MLRWLVLVLLLAASAQAGLWPRKEVSVTLGRIKVVALENSAEAAKVRRLVPVASAVLWSFFRLRIMHFFFGYAVKGVLKFWPSKNWRRLRRADDNKRFLKAVNLAVSKSDMFKRRMFGQLDVYEMTNWNQTNAGTLTESQVLVVTSEFLAEARRAPCEVTAATIAHELGHMRKHHSLRVVQFWRVVEVLVAVSYKFLWQTLDARLRGLVFFFPKLVSFLLVEFGAGMEVSQRFEYEADAYAARALGENNVILCLQEFGSVPMFLIRLQHALGTILVPSCFFRHENVKYSFLIRLEYFLRTGIWIPRSGALTHPSTEMRMLRLYQLKRDRLAREAQEAAQHSAFLNV